MRIITLRAENLKRLKAVEITPRAVESVRRRRRARGALSMCLKSLRNPRPAAANEKNRSACRSRPGSFVA